MNCPSKVTREEFNALVDAVFQTFKKDGEKWICPNCGSVILQKTAFVSVHDSRFSICAGSGKVIRTAIPYCPKCEPTIDAKAALSGCVHV